jgi:hypothetical protein
MQPKLATVVIGSYLRCFIANMNCNFQAEEKRRSETEKKMIKVWIFNPHAFMVDMISSFTRSEAIC